MNKERIGFIGLGNMGGRMARRLVDAGIAVLGYDTARVLVEGLFRAPIYSGPGLKDGLERIRFMPSTTGGVHTHIAASPYEHGMFRGDWLLYGRVTNGKLAFEGLFEPLE